MSNIFFSKGIGKYGIVRKASKIAEPATFFAVKTMQKNSKRLQSILNEISIDFRIKINYYYIYFGINLISLFFKAPCKD